MLQGITTMKVVWQRDSGSSVKKGNISGINIIGREKSQC